MKVLIVDDDPSFGHLTQRRLERMGHQAELHLGPNGTAAKLVDGSFDVLLLDVEMPGMSGPELFDLLRGLPKVQDVAVLLYSSTDTIELRRIAERCGAHGYLNKSAASQELELKLREVRDSRRPSSR